MTSSGTKGGGKGPLSVLIWAAVAAVLAAFAYLAGAGLAQRWMEPSLALPAETPVPSPGPVQAAAAWLTPGDPAEGKLGPEARDEWQFRGRAGQSATLEMWLHPGSGSSVEAELAVHLIAPDGTVLAQEAGSIFLPPYLLEPRLPATGLYRVQVVPASGAPGRYSLLLTLSDGAAPVTPDASASPQPPTAVPDAVVADADFQWPTTRREISGWTFHDPRNPGHIGLDIAARMLDPIVAVADGQVVFAEWGGGYGNLVIVEHGGGWLSYYAHLEEIVVEVGQGVRQGELLGGAGTTGYSTGPHLHFELRYKGRPVDPHVHLP